MKKRILIATNINDHTQSLLPKEKIMVCDGYELIQVEPQTKLIGDQVIPNHDLLVTSRTDAVVAAMRCVPKEAVIFVPFYEKAMQAAILHKLFREKEGIYIPKTWGCIDNSGGRYDSLHHDYSDTVVIKSTTGARGEEQIYCHRNLISSVVQRLKYCGGMDARKVMDTYPDAVVVPTTESDSCFRDDNLLIQEYINVQKEFRVNFVGDRYWVGYRGNRKSHKSASGLLEYTQCNVERGSTVTEMYTYASDNYLLNNPHKTFLDSRMFLTLIEIQTLHQIVKTVIAYAGLPAGSIDIFVDNSGRMGVFEFSSEYGSEKIPSNILAEIHNATCQYLIERFKNAYKE